MIIEDKNLVTSVAFRPILGKGTTAVAFLTKDKKVLKVFLNNYRKWCAFQDYDMLKHLENLSNIKVKNVYTPNDIYVKNGQVIATKLDYIKGNVLKKHVPNIPLKVFTEMLLELIEETYKLTELGVYVHDFHNKNVIINENGINIFDTDEFEVTVSNNGDFLNHNLSSFLHTILLSIFKFPKDFRFDNEYLDTLLFNFYKGTIESYEDDLELYYALCKEFGENESLKKVSKLVKEIGRY